MTIEEVLKRHEDALMRLPNVVAVGIGEKEGRKVIQVFVSSIIPNSSLAPGERIPKTIDRYDVAVEEIGTVTAPPSGTAKEK